MSNIEQGIVAGLAFGLVNVAMMLPMEFKDKRTALWGAFLGRFAIGFVIAVAVLPTSGWIKGAALGLLISLPDSVITQNYAPILVTGAIGGAIIGLIVH